MRLAKTLLLLVCAVLSLPAAAGLNIGTVTTVDNKAGYAWAAMGLARDNNDGYLLCEVSGPNAYCWGQDKAKNEFSCHSNVQAFVKNARAINTASFVAVYWDPVRSDFCTDMWLSNGSQYLPETHKWPSLFKVLFGTNSATGIVSGIRYNTGNPEEYLSCDIHASSGHIYCAARNNGLVTYHCYTGEGVNPLFAEGVRAIEATSMVTFNFDPNTGMCTTISVRKSSNFVH